MKKLVCLLSLMAVASHAQSKETLEYTWLTVGEPSGSQTTAIESDSLTRIDFHFNDRGRGPNTSTQVTLGDNGVPIALLIRGTNYENGEITEKFALDGDQAQWSSEIESGGAPSDGTAFYWPNNAPPALIATLARAILNHPDERLALLPTGNATIEALSSMTLEQGGGEITLYGISGLDTTPTYVWLDDQQRLFGVDYGWFGITRKGFEQKISALKAGQDAATDRYYRELAATLTRPIDGLLAIRGARIFDSLTGELTEPATVTIWDGTISAIYFDDVALPAETTVIDASGHTLLPALWDMHGHVRSNNLLNYIAAGVTNVRDLANDHAELTKLSREVRDGNIVGPDIHPLGFIDKRGEFSAPTGRLADTLEEAVALVDLYAQQGYHGIKLYSSIEPDWVKPIADYAHKRGLSVKGHVPAFMSATQAIDAGYDEITHLNMIWLDFMGGETLDTRTPARFKIPGEKAGAINLRSRPVKALIRRMRERDIALDPTVSIFMNMFLNEPGKVSPIFRDIADHLPATARRASIASTGFNAGKESQFAASAEKSLQLLRRLHENGVRLLPGTDNALPGFTLIRELMYYAEAGIPAGETLQLATIGAARHLNLDQQLGSISVGKKAHLYLVEGDPLDNLRNLYKTRQVIKGRRIYSGPEILRAQGFRPF